MLLWAYVAFYTIFFASLTWTNFRFAAGFFIISLPAYLIRFNIGPLSTTLLEVTFGILFLIWLVKYARADWPAITYHVTHNKLFFSACCLFLLASVVSIFVSDMWIASAGEWRAYFLEPMMLFVVLVGRTRRDAINRVSTNDLIWFLILSTISVSIVAIIQKFTGQLYPPSLWDDELGGRVTSFFTSPNAVGLYLGPIVMLAIAAMAKRFNQKANPRLGGVGVGWRFLFLIAVLLINLLAIIFTKSVGAWAALIIGVLLFIVFLGYPRLHRVQRKKTAATAAIVGVLLIFLIPAFKSVLIFKEKSGGNRLTLWSYSWEYLAKSPKNFVLGTGIRQFFRKVQKPFYDVKKMERLIYPHNIFLNFWTETGLVGMISFVGIYCSLVVASYSLYKTDQIIGAGLISSLAALLIHGLVDVPYFKNDLAMLFWIMAAIVIGAKVAQEKA